MTLILSGSNGLSDVDGSAATPAVRGTDANTGIYFGSDVVAFSTGGVQRSEFDATGNFKFNSGYGSVATAYGCRAWVNFNGTANSNLSGTYSQSGTTVTVTATGHGLIAGNSIYADITTGTGVDGIYTVATVTDANTFTYTAGTSLTTSGNITLLRNTIRGSGNVSSVTDNATGDYTVNFATAMPDANYVTSGTVSDSVSAATAPALSLNVYFGTTGQTASSVRVVQGVSTGAANDRVLMSVAIFR